MEDHMSDTRVRYEQLTQWSTNLPPATLLERVSYAINAIIQSAAIRHLEIGTQKENMKDMRERERHGIPKIVKNAWLKLYANGVTFKAIGERYGVSATAVSNYINQAEKQAKETLDATLAQQSEEQDESEDEACVQSEGSSD